MAFFDGEERTTIEGAVGYGNITRIATKSSKYEHNTKLNHSTSIIKSFQMTKAERYISIVVIYSILIERAFLPSKSPYAS